MHWGSRGFTLQGSVGDCFTRVSLRVSISVSLSTAPGVSGMGSGVGGGWIGAGIGIGTGLRGAIRSDWADAPTMRARPDKKTNEIREIIDWPSTLISDYHNLSARATNLVVTEAIFARQLPLSPMQVFAIGIEHAIDGLETPMAPMRATRPQRNRLAA
jgi:hypothetical protein